MGLRLRASWDCGFDSSHEYGWLSVGNVAYCRAETLASGRSLFQRSPTKCGVSECDLEVSTMGGLGPLGAVASWGKNGKLLMITVHWHAIY